MTHRNYIRRRRQFFGIAWVTSHGSTFVGPPRFWIMFQLTHRDSSLEVPYFYLEHGTIFGPFEAPVFDAGALR